MDRNNLFTNPGSTTLTVALRKESVDRNVSSTGTMGKSKRSLSARRAWIEIAVTSEVSDKVPLVALRKESVDRNSVLWG